MSVFFLPRNLRSFQALLTQQGECFPASRSTLDYFPYPRANANGDSPGPKIQKYAPGNGSKDATGESFYGSGKGFYETKNSLPIEIRT